MHYKQYFAGNWTTEGGNCLYIREKKKHKKRMRKERGKEESNSPVGAQKPNPKKKTTTNLKKQPPQTKTHPNQKKPRQRETCILNSSRGVLNETSDTRKFGKETRGPPATREKKDREGRGEAPGMRRLEGDN